MQIHISKIDYYWTRFSNAKLLTITKWSKICLRRPQFLWTSNFRFYLCFAICHVEEKNEKISALQITSTIFSDYGFKTTTTFKIFSFLFVLHILFFYIYIYLCVCVCTLLKLASWGYVSISKISSKMYMNAKQRVFCFMSHTESMQDG